MGGLFTFTNAILLLGALQGLILAALLLAKRRGSVDSRLMLTGMLTFLSLAILMHVLSSARLLPFSARHDVVIEVLMLLNAPLLYLYVKSLTTARFALVRLHLLHLLPFSIGLPIGWLLIQSDGPFPIDQSPRQVLEALVYTVTLGYVAAANILLRRYARDTQETRPAVQRTSLGWLRFFVFSLTLFWILAGIIHAFFKVATMDVAWGASCVILYLIGYFGFAPPFAPPASQEDGSDIARKYEKSSLTPVMAAEHLAKLLALMSAERPFMDREISLAALAVRLRIPLHHLSQIINAHLGKSFYDFINEQRIGEAKKMLVDPAYRHQSISSIALDVGFNSLSAFNAAFRRFARTTPSKFRSAGPV